VAAAISGASGVGTFSGGPVGTNGLALIELAGLGVLVDWYPVPRDGWHLGGIWAIGMTWAADASGSAFSAAAPSASILGGYDWWTSPQWSQGILLAVSASTPATMKDAVGSDSGYSIGALAFVLQWSALYH
jgi:hypothetical protein